MKTHADVLQEQLTEMACGVDAFHREIVHAPAMDPPAPLPEDRHAFRVKFILEELEEYVEAYKIGNFPEQVDAVVDLIYVAIGALLEMGVNPMEAFRPVQAANMAKIQGMSKRGHATDAIKPLGWTPPDHAAVVARMHLMSQVSEVFVKLTEMRLKKGANYNRGTVKREDHFPLGSLSYFQMVWIKTIRLRSLVESTMGGDHAARPETTRLIDRELNDLINYACFWSEDINGINMEDR